MKIVLGITGTERRLETLQSVFPEVEFVMVENGPWVQIENQVAPLWLLERASKLPGSLAMAVPPKHVGIVVGRGIPQDERDMLEHDGMSWLDLRGAMHLKTGSKLIRIDRIPSRPGSLASMAPRARKLGPVGMRAAQSLVTFGEDFPWSTKDLVDRAGVSMGQAHNVLTDLEELGLVRTVARAGKRVRVVKDRAALLDWMSTNEQNLRTPPSLYSYLYAKNEMDLARRLAKIAQESGVQYAITASLGARLWDVPVTTSVVTRVRIASADLDSVRMALQLPVLSPDEAGRGANLELWQDTGEVGTQSAVSRDEIQVAPIVRVWLDLTRQGGRYADGAEMLKRKILERT